VWLSHPCAEAISRPGADLDLADHGQRSVNAECGADLVGVAGTAAGLYLLYLIRGVLELIVLAVFLALALGPLVEFLTRRRLSRVVAIFFAYLGLVAIFFAYLGLFGMLVFLGLVAVPPIATQINAGVRQLPTGTAAA
jgi:predicted PurR-regulated permease PerM